MSQPFLISGLPRSRTAWFSVATLTDRSICTHEPTAITQSFEELKKLWVEPKFPGISVGMSDHGLGLWLGRILEEIGPRTLIVKRDIQQVEKSLAKLFVDVPMDWASAVRFLDALETELSKWKHHPLVKCVSFDDLDDHSVVTGVLSWLVPGASFPDLKHLMAMNIQARRDRVLSLVSKPHTGWFLSPGLCEGKPT